MVHPPGPSPLPCHSWHRLPSQLGTDISEDLKPPLPLDQHVPAAPNAASSPLLLPPLLPCPQGCLTVVQTVLTYRDCLCSNGTSLLISTN